MNVADVTASLNSLVSSHKHAITELNLLPPDDPLRPVLQGFIDKTTPQIDKLKRLHADLLAELTSLLAYFAEKADQPVENVFATILSFALGLQKAAAEMAKIPGTIKRKPFRAAAAAVPAVHHAGPSDTSSNGGDVTPTGTITLDDQSSASALGITRGEFDEAIRTIHGGARRRERQEASMASSMAGSIKLSRMFLDGKGTTRGSVTGTMRGVGAGAGGTGRMAQLRGGEAGKPPRHARLASVFR